VMRRGVTPSAIIAVAVRSAGPSRDDRDCAEYPVRRDTCVKLADSIPPLDFPENIY
jgi:hypothetical protein